MKFREAIQFIIDEEQEINAIKVLFEAVETRLRNAEHESAETSFCLRAIHKINDARIKDDAIAALSEV